MKAYLAEHRDKYGIRRYIKEPLEIVKVSEKGV
jgi:hypothetical protein